MNDTQFYHLNDNLANKHRDLIILSEKAETVKLNTEKQSIPRCKEEERKKELTDMSSKIDDCLKIINNSLICVHNIRNEKNNISTEQLKEYIHEFDKLNSRLFFCSTILNSLSQLITKPPPFVTNAMRNIGCILSNINGSIKEDVIQNFLTLSS